MHEQLRDSQGTVLCIEDEGFIRIGFHGASKGWQADPADFQRFEEFKVGDWVCVRKTPEAAKHDFGIVTAGSIGIVHGIRSDSSLLIEFSCVTAPCIFEPEEVEPVVPFKVVRVLFFFYCCLFLKKSNISSYSSPYPTSYYSLRMYTIVLFLILFYFTDR